MMLSVEASRDARQIIINPHFTRRRGKHGEHGEKPAKRFTLTLNDGQFICLHMKFKDEEIFLARVWCSLLSPRLRVSVFL
jgi:hypothetical protein